jgi:hypothetical protein
MVRAPLNTADYEVYMKSAWIKVALASPSFFAQQPQTAAFPGATRLASRRATPGCGPSSPRMPLLQRPLSQGFKLQAAGDPDAESRAKVYEDEARSAAWDASCREFVAGSFPLLGKGAGLVAGAAAFTSVSKIAREATGDYPYWEDISTHPVEVTVVGLFMAAMFYLSGLGLYLGIEASDVLAKDGHKAQKKWCKQADALRNEAAKLQAKAVALRSPPPDKEG